MSDNTKQKYVWLWLIAGLALFAMIVFWEALSPSRCLMTTDDNISGIPSLKALMPQAVFGAWNDAVFMGSAGGRIAVMWTNVFLWLTPIWFGFNWVHAVGLLLASLLLAKFMRSAGLCWAAIVVGLIAAFWVGSNLTLTYAGHMGKFGVLIFGAASLYGIRMTFGSDRPWLWSMLTGGALGFMLMEQQDLALFFGLVLGAYAMFRIGMSFTPNAWFKIGLRLLPMGLIAFLISSATLLGSYSRNVSDTKATSENDPRQKWEFSTQWSWPPEESVDFIAMGYTGWRSGDDEGPYWGRMGRSAGWEKTGQGFMNFKLENQYLGAIPLVFALFAAWIAVIWRRADPGQDVWPTMRAEMIFWLCVAAITLLLSFGKHFPLYWLFYQLPVVNNIRNPNKFLQVFQVAFGILAAYGLDAMMRCSSASNRRPA